MNQHAVPLDLLADDGEIPLFLNQASGSAPADPDAFAQRIHPALKPRFLPPQQIAGAIIDEVRAGTPIVAVAGGDGTLRGAAEVLAGTDTALLPVPSGTLNHFARRLGLDSVEACAEALRHGSIETVSVGTFTEWSDERDEASGPVHVFLNTLTFGEYAYVLRIRERLRPYLSKWPAAAVGFWTAVFRGRRIRVQLELENEALERSTTLIWLGIGWGSFPLVHEAPERRAAPDLEVAVLRAHTPVRAAGLLFRLTARKLRREEMPVRDRAVELLHARTLLLHGRHRIDSTADGEIFRVRPPVRIAVYDRLLRVLVPPQRDR